MKRIGLTAPRGWSVALIEVKVDTLLAMVHLNAFVSLAVALWTNGDHSVLSDMFALGVPLFEKIIRTILVYVALMVGIRVSGKRELAQLNPFDLIVLLMLSNTVQNAIIGDDNTITGGLIGAATLLALNYALVRSVYHNRGLRSLIAGKADVLVKDGKLLRDHLERELITPEELKAAARQQGISTLKDVETCVLEPTGEISFIERRPSSDDQRHNELLDRLDALAREVAALKAGAR